MADLSKQVEAMKAANTGPEIRQPLADALTILSEQGRKTEALNGKNSDYFAKQSDMGKLLPMDASPRKGSTKLATSGGIFAMIGDMDNFDWGDDDWLI